ncbi:helix-turn-helix domain-containing protein [Plantactinospora solaniradicis]|uniref:Helix-turn-helix domain-containing protein n=1 Tax=Plantactinospora solaniradicis TaxID=1723736 RepID=A0ABW1KJE2_9ACTN
MKSSVIYACGRAVPLERGRLARDWFRPHPDATRRLLLRQASTTGRQDTHQPERQESQVLLTVAEACQRLRISKWMLQQLINRRQLRSVKLGSRRLIPASAINELLDRLSAQEAL